MTQTIIRILLGLVLVAVGAAADTDRGKPAEETKKTSAEADAEKAGKVRTPFGYVDKRKVEKPATPPKPSKPLVDVKVSGDTVTFSRKTPFGVQAWERSRGELSHDERKLAEQAGVDVSVDKDKPGASSDPVKEDDPDQL